MTAQQELLFEELSEAIRRQPDCASLVRYGGRIKTLIAANQGTREEITPEMYGRLRSVYAQRKREIEANEASEARIRVAVAFIEKCRDIAALNRDYEQAKQQFGGNLPPAVRTAYEQRLNELEQILEQQKAKQKLAEFGLEFGDAPYAGGALYPGQVLGAGAASTAGGANDFPYCD